MGNILWIASYPKSGNTWMRVFLENYLANQDKPVDINTIHTRALSEANSYHYADFLPAGKRTTDMDILDICRIRHSVHRRIAEDAQGTTFVKTHNYLGEYKGCPLHNNQVTSGAIYIVRNPLDVVVSLSKYFGFSIDEAIEFMADEMTGTSNEVHNVPQIITSWSMHVQSWTQHEESNILVLRYEDMLSHPQRAFRKVESFLRLKKDPKRLRKAIQFSSFNSLKAQEAQSGFVEKFENASVFFRKGEKNQWQDVLADAQIDRIKQNHKEMMTKFKYI